MIRTAATAVCAATYLMPPPNLSECGAGRHTTACRRLPTCPPGSRRIHTVRACRLRSNNRTARNVERRAGGRVRRSVYRENWNRAWLSIRFEISAVSDTRSVWMSFLYCVPDAGQRQAARFVVPVEPLTVVARRQQIAAADLVIDLRRTARARSACSSPARAAAAGRRRRCCCRATTWPS